MVQRAVAALRTQVDAATHGAGLTHADNDVADAAEPQALVGGFDAQIFFASIDNGPAQLFYRGMGADILPDWRITRVTGEALKKLAGIAPKS